MNKKLVVWILMVFLVASSALAVSKPIAGKVNGGTGTVELFVEVDFLNQKTLCVLNPKIETGPTGEFASNLANLVLQNFPQKSCSSYWKAGDRIWFEYKGYQSTVEQIKAGTGLQYLSTLNLPIQESPSGGSSGGGSSGTDDSTSIPSSLEIEIPVTLTAEQNLGTVESLLKIKIPQNLNKDLDVKIVLSDFFNDQALEIKSDNFFLANEFERKYLFDMAKLEAGQYKIQAFVYDDSELIGISNIVKFTLAALDGTEGLLETPQPTYPVYLYIILIFIIAALVIAIIWFKLKK